MKVTLGLALLVVCSVQAQDVDMRADIELRKRAPTAVMRQFRKDTGFPKGRPGYVIDHVVPLCAGGPDSIGNLQWQDRAASYRKDVFERQLCAAMKREGLILVRKDDRP